MLLLYSVRDVANCLADLVHSLYAAFDKHVSDPNMKYLKKSAIVRISKMQGCTVRYIVIMKMSVHVYTVHTFVICLFKYLFYIPYCWFNFLILLCAFPPPSIKMFYKIMFFKYLFNMLFWILIVNWNICLYIWIQSIDVLELSNLEIIL